jgi:hypothetical protein
MGPASGWITSAAASDGVALEGIRADHPGHVWQAFEQPFDECLGRPLVATTRHQHVEGVLVLIHGPLQAMASAMDGHPPLVEMPMVSGPRPTTSQLMGVGVAEGTTRPTDRFAAHHHPTVVQQRFGIAVAQAQAAREPEA